MDHIKIQLPDDLKLSAINMLAFKLLLTELVNDSVNILSGTDAEAETLVTGSTASGASSNPLRKADGGERSVHIIARGDSGQNRHLTA